jgi:hypothetical protein
MITSNCQVGDIVEGYIESANDHGIKVGGEWRNASKFHPVDLPDRATRLRLELRSAAICCGHRATVHEDVTSTDVLKVAQTWLEWMEAEK